MRPNLRPRPKAWKKGDFIDWLKKNKSSDEDVIYSQTCILNYITKYKDAMKRWIPP